MTVSLLLVGDYQHGLADLDKHLRTRYNTVVINFIDTTDTQLDPSEAVETIDIRDFHQLTIRLMELEPVNILYLSYYHQFGRCQNNPDLADMANREAIAHLKDITGIHHSKILLLSPDLAKDPQGTIVGKTAQLGEQEVYGIRRKAILKIPPLWNNSPVGLKAWLSTNAGKQKNSLPTTYQIVSPEYLSNVCTKIIENKITGSFEIVEAEIDLPDWGDINSALNYSGHPNEYTRPFAYLENNFQLD